MGHWNNRIIHHPEGHYAVHEVHYDDDGNVRSYAGDPTVLLGDSPEEVKAALAQMAKDLDKLPVLEWDRLPTDEGE